MLSFIYTARYLVPVFCQMYMKETEASGHTKTFDGIKCKFPPPALPTITLTCA